MAQVYSAPHNQTSRRANATPSDVQTLQSLGSRLHAPGCVVGNYLMQENRSGNQQLNLHCLWLSMHDYAWSIHDLHPRRTEYHQGHPIMQSFSTCSDNSKHCMLNFCSSSHITTSICSNDLQCIFKFDRGTTGRRGPATEGHERCRPTWAFGVYCHTTMQTSKIKYIFNILFLTFFTNTTTNVW